MPAACRNDPDGAGFMYNKRHDTAFKYTEYYLVVIVAAERSLGEIVSTPRGHGSFDTDLCHMSHAAVDTTEENIYSTTSPLGDITTRTRAACATSAITHRREPTIFSSR